MGHMDAQGRPLEVKPSDRESGPTSETQDVALQVGAPMVDVLEQSQNSGDGRASDKAMSRETKQERKQRQQSPESLDFHFEDGMTLYEMLNAEGHFGKNKTKLALKGLSLMTTNQIIANIYAKKLVQDATDDRLGRARMTLPLFIRDYFTRQYGLKDLATKHTLNLVRGLGEFSATSSRVRTFMKLAGTKEGFKVGSQGIDFILFALSQALDANNKDDYAMVPKTMGDGIANQQRISAEVCKRTIQTVFQGRKRAETLASSFSQAMFLDDFLEKVLEKWTEHYEEELLSLKDTFIRFDSNGDGILSLEEFEGVVHSIDPDYDARDLVQLYHQAAGDDGVIDPSEFVGVMATLQRNVTVRRQVQIEELKRQGLSKLIDRTSASTEKARKKSLLKYK